MPSTVPADLMTATPLAALRAPARAGAAPRPRRLRVLAAAAAMLLTGSALAEEARPPAATLARLRSTNLVTIGYRTDILPFSYVDAAKNPIGYAIDVCSELVARLRTDLKLPALRMEFVQVTAADRIEAITTGRIDMECGQTVNNRERRRDVTFALPYYFSGPRMLVRADSGIHAFTDLVGKRIVVVKGTNSVPLLKERIEHGMLANAALVEAPSNDAAFAIMEKGDAAALVGLDNSLYALRSSAAKPTAWIVSGASLALEPVGIVLRKRDPDFKAAIDRALGALMLDGVVARIYARWFESPIPPNGVVLGIRAPLILREQWRWPSDRNADEIGD